MGTPPFLLDFGAALLLGGCKKTHNYQRHNELQEREYKRSTFHTSRHTFAVLMLSAGVDIYTLSRLLGHSSVTVTQVYADIVDGRRKAAVDLFPKI